MSTEHYSNCMSRNLMRVSGTVYSENRPARLNAETAGRTLKDYAGLPHLAKGGYLPLSITVLPLQVHWLGQ